MLPIYRALIADDEPLLRRHLQQLLKDTWPELEIVGLASDGEEAWGMVLDLCPDIVFLDIRMPVLDGISLARRLTQLNQPPLVVFATAYDEHAVDAFENEAVDYLLKPVDVSRLEKSIKRLQERLASKQVDEQNEDEDPDLGQLHKLLSRLSPENQTPEKQRLKWIRASKQDTIHVLAVESVDYFQADNKYTSVRVGLDEYLIRTSIMALENSLDPELFWRIHRNAIVRVDQIARVERDFSGHLFLYLKEHKTRFTVSRSYQALFKQM